MSMKPYNLLALLFVFVSCSTSPQIDEDLEADIAPHVYTGDHVADSVSIVDARIVSPSVYTGVRKGEALRTYQVGRTPSKDRRSMREAHQVYRVAKQNAWDLHGTTVPPALSRSSQPALPTLSPLTDPEIEAEKERQKEITQRLERMEEQFSGWKKEMKAIVEQERGALSPQPETSVSPVSEQADAVEAQDQDGLPQISTALFGEAVLEDNSLQGDDPGHQN